MSNLNDSIRLEVSKLVENIYSREAELASLGINSFSPALRFVEEFAESKLELEEYKKYTIQSIKSRIYPDLAFEKWLEEKKHESRQRYIASGCVEDDEFLSFRYRYTKMEVNDPELLQTLKRPYIDEIESLWHQESELNASLISNSSKNGTIKSSMDAYLFAMKEFGKTISLERLKLFEHKNFPLYGKEIDDELMLGILLDSKLLHQPAPRIVAAAKPFVSGASLGLSIRLFRKSDKKVKPEYGLTYGFEFFFPIREYPLGLTCYRYFKSEEELVALVVIYTKLFEIVHCEFLRIVRSACSE